jgi:hypothetical protein
MTDAQRERRKEYFREYQRRWREAHPGYHAEHERKRRAVNPEAAREAARKWRARNKAKHAAYMREYLRTHPEQRKKAYERQKQYRAEDPALRKREYERNRDAYISRAKQYRAANPEKLRQRDRDRYRQPRRRAQKIAWAAKFRASNPDARKTKTCICGTKMHYDSSLCKECCYMARQCLAKFGPVIADFESIKHELTNPNLRGKLTWLRKMAQKIEQLRELNNQPMIQRKRSINSGA